MMKQEKIIYDINDAKKTLQAIPIMKTIDETATHFNLPKYFCRRAVLDGKVPYVKSGRKYLINAERFAEWLNTGEPQRSVEQPLGKIRKLH